MKTKLVKFVILLLDKKIISQTGPDQSSNYGPKTIKTGPGPVLGPVLPGPIQPYLSPFKMIQLYSMV